MKDYKYIWNFENLCLSYKENKIREEYRLEADEDCDSFDSFAAFFAISPLSLLHSESSALTRRNFLNRGV